MIAAVATLTIALAPILAQPADGTRPVLQTIPNPAGERSSLPNLITAPDGRVLLSWVEPGERGLTRLRFASLGAEGWSEARTVAEGQDWFVNWADLPSLAVLSDGTLAASWLARVGSETYAYGVQVSLSRDGGKTWSAPIVPHSDRSANEHGFVSMAAVDAGRFVIVWLDGRARSATAAAPAAHGEAEGHGGGGIGLFGAALDRDGKVVAERTIDPRTCECCPTSIERVGDSLLVAYRDHADDGTRDCAIVSVTAEGNSEPRPIHADGWKADGCPVNGPALASRGEEVAAAWYSEAKGRPQVLIALSADGGKTFGEPIGIDDGNPVGRVDLATHPDQGWLAVWLERGDGGGEVRGRAIGAAGELRPSVLIARTSPERASGFPRLVRSGRRVVLAWTESLAKGAGAGGAADPARVRTADLVFPPPEASAE
jgi:hypothetical protein